MNHYQIRYYNSGGYKSSAELKTKHRIVKDANNAFLLIDDGKVIGGIDEIEALLLVGLGYEESITIVAVELIKIPPNLS